MLSTKRLLIFSFLFFLSESAFSEVDSSRYFIGTSAFMLANLNREEKDPPHFYQLNFGYRLTGKDVVSAELITWRYNAPIGASNIGASNIDRFPGYAEAKGLGVAYQRFIFDRFYTALHATWFNQNFFGLNNEKLSSGKQLFLTLRLGYRYSFGSDRFFIEPNLAATFWPINTNLPEAFQKREDNAPKYGVEPGLHVGFVF